MNTSKMAGILLLVSLFWAGCKTPPKWEFQQTMDLGNIKPLGMTLAGDQDFWVADAANNRIVRLDSNARIMAEYGNLQRPMHIVWRNNKVYIPEYLRDTIKVIENGNISVLPLEEKPDAPAGIDLQGKKLAVADFFNHRIILQNKDGWHTIGEEGHDQGQLYYPTDLKFFNNKLYVADAYNNRIQVFNEKRESIRVIGVEDGLKVASGIDVNNQYIAITDQENNRVILYDHDGKKLQVLSQNIDYPTEVVLTHDALYVVNFEGQSIAEFRLK